MFYLKIQTDNGIEKCQKLTVVQGDTVKYEENFNGIKYSGTWSDIEDENFSGEKAKCLEYGAYIEFNCYGDALDYISIGGRTSRHVFNTSF